MTLWIMDDDMTETIPTISGNGFISTLYMTAQECDELEQQKKKPFGFNMKTNYEPDPKPVRKPKKKKGKK